MNRSEEIKWEWVEVSFKDESKIKVLPLKLKKKPISFCRKISSEKDKKQ